MGELIHDFALRYHHIASGAHPVNAGTDALSHRNSISLSHNSAMAPGKPGPKTWVLRCKLHKTTVLLYSDPATTLTALKQELRKSLLEVYPTGSIETATGTTSIPSSIDGIILGKLVDSNNVRRGWERIGDEVDDIDWAFRDKGKGKAVAGNGKSQNDNSKVTVQSVGLADGALVGIMLRGSADVDVVPTEANGMKTDVWDIVLPKLETDEEEEDLYEDDAAISDSEITIPAVTSHGGIYNT